MQDAGTFTQVVWKNSKEFALSFYKEDRSIYAVGVYFPAGNVEDEYLENVFKPQEKKSSSVFEDIPTIPSLPKLPNF